MNFDASYQILKHKKLERSINSLPSRIKKVFEEKLRYFAQNPYHPSLNTKPYNGVSSKVKRQLGIDDVYEFYINRKEYRCLLYVIHNTKEILLVYVGTHDQLKNFCKSL